MRRYGAWGGAPAGYPEDTKQCAAQVPVGGRSPLFRQCMRKRPADGLLCTQHAKERARGLYVNVPEEERE
jgi:hypothetical protein